MVFAGPHVAGSHLEGAHALAPTYLDAQLAGDRAAALRVVLEGAEHGVPVRDLQLGVIQAAQREIGRLWQENRINVAQEHLATSISQVVMARLYEHIPRETANGRTAVVGCIEGEHHDLGARMGADFLEMAGFDVRFLGGNVPTRSLAEMVGDTKPDLVGLSVAMTYNVPTLVDAVSAIRKVAGDRFPILVGGHVLAWAPELEKQIGVVAFGTSADAIVAKCRQELGW